MNDITKIKVDGEPESSYKLFPKNREFEKRAGGNTGSQSVVQSDWNQNDETAPDYIKNKPFYTGDPVETVLVEESTVQFTDIGGLFTGAIKSMFSPTVGNAYKISWDGTDYESTCVKVGRDVHIGNLSIDGSGPDTGEPFLMYVTDQGIEVATLDGASYHTFSISRLVTEVVKIDEKYLPTIPAPIYIIRKDSVFSSSATFEEVWKLPPNVLASRLTLVLSALGVENGFGFSCREVTKENTMNRGKHIVATFAALSANNNNTYDTENYAIVWDKAAITQLTPNEGSITP